MTHAAGVGFTDGPIVPLVALSTEDAAVQRAFHRTSEGRGGVANVFRAIANSPELLEVFAPIGTFFRSSSVMSPELREAIILAVALDAGSEYEWSQHVRIAARLGIDHLAVIGLGGDLPPDDVVNAAVAIGRSTAAGTPLDAGRVQQVVDAIGHRGLVEVTALAAYYGMLAKMIDAWQVPLDDGLRAEPMPQRRADV